MAWLTTGIMDARIFEGVIRDSSVAVTVIDGDKPELPIVYANDAYLRQSAHQLEDLVGQPSFVEDRFEDNRAAVTQVRQAVRDGCACKVVIRTHPPNDSNGWSEIDLYPLASDEGGHLFAAIHRDISEHMEAENRLRTTNKALLRLAIHDSLTGIYNRHFFDQMLRREWRIQARARGELAILMIDIDDFKSLNDQLGHRVGDECLRAVASTLDATLRRGSDFVARYGGDEFVALLTGTTVMQAAQVAEIICESVRSLAVPAASMGSTGNSRPVTVTVGVAARSAVPELDAETLLLSADAALYQAKIDGKNRVAVNDRVSGADPGQSTTARAGRRS